MYLTIFLWCEFQILLYNTFHLRPRKKHHCLFFEMTFVALEGSSSRRVTLVVKLFCFLTVTSLTCNKIHRFPMAVTYILRLDYIFEQRNKKSFFVNHRWQQCLNWFPTSRKWKLNSEIWLIFRQITDSSSSSIKITFIRTWWNYAVCWSM